MVSIRTTARALLVLALLGFAAGTAAALPPPELPGSSKARHGPTRDQIVFPVLGTVTFTDDFGAPRPQGPHQGIDILAPKRALALAAEPGRVRFFTGSGRAGCMLYLDGASGTTYLYVHLNNDLTQGNDNRGGCRNGVTFPRGLRTGARVQAGQPVGFVGDSGDADGLHPHLHFEVHPHGGRARNPYPYLIAARRLLFYMPAGTTFTLALSGIVVSATDASLRVRIGTLRALPGSLTLRNLGRSLTLAVPSYATVERGEHGSSTHLATAKRGERVIVWTEPADVTADAEAGKDGIISAARIVLPAT
ncbi:MAG: M23 family metallopeptidase [Actinobacteria bacterium]|nr:MAG: M23 family metallopeptidase [Actinomycetota bacterium]